jgi:hypothetical protein
MLADTAPELCGGHVFWVNGIRVERSSIIENRDKAAVLRAVKMQRIKPSVEAPNTGNDLRQAPKSSHVLFTRAAVDIAAILPNNHMSQHSPFLLLQPITPFMT